MPFFFQFFIDISVYLVHLTVVCSMDIISNSSQESNVCIKLHSSSELSVVSVISFTCCERHMRAKCFGLLQFLHCFLMAAQFFKFPSIKGFPHLLHGFLSSVLCLASAFPSSCFRLFLSRLNILFCWFLFPTAKIGSCLIFICEFDCDIVLQYLMSISERLVLFAYFVQILMHVLTPHRATMFRT